MSKLELPVEEYTTPDPITAEEAVGIEELAALMRDNGIRHLPIMRQGQVVGIVSERDVRLVSGLNLDEKRLITAKDIMSADPVTVNCQTPLDEVAFEMSKQKIGSVVVTGEKDEFLGIFTVTDALNALIEVSRANH